MALSTTAAAFVIANVSHAATIVVILIRLTVGSPMACNDEHNTETLVREERQRWSDRRLLTPGALRDFQTLSDEAFRSLKGKYYRPADLIADAHSRRFLG